MKTWQEDVRALCKQERDSRQSPRQLRRDPRPYPIPAKALKLVKIAYHNDR